MTIYRLRLDDQWLADSTFTGEDRVLTTSDIEEAMIFDQLVFAEVIAKVVSSMYPEYEATIVGK